MDQTGIYLEEEKNSISVEHSSLMRWRESGTLPDLTISELFTKEEQVLV